MSINTSSVSAVNSASWDTASSTGSNSTLGMQSFLKLMAAQMQNQSMTSQTDDSQYITEMTLYTAIQAINSQTAEANKQYAASLVGSNVLINTTDKSTGAAKQITGTVSRAVFSTSSDKVGVQIGDTIYDVSRVSQVLGNNSGDTTTTSTRQYAASLIGKNVIVKTTDSTTGEEQETTGQVQSVSFAPTTGEATLTLTDGQMFGVSDVMRILEGSGT